MTNQQGAPEAFTDFERCHAIRQGHEIAASDSYFEARPQIDSNDRRKVFEAGFDRGWDRHAALVEAQQPAPSAASKAVLAAIRAANMQLVRTGDDEFMLVTHKQATPQADSQPAPEYVGNGMFKGETIEKAAEHWANWCDVRCMTGLSEFLRVVAARAPADSVTAPAGGGAVVEWHAPGLGEVHNESHGQLIFCTDGDDVADDTLARRVCAALNATPAATPSAASLAWTALRDLTDPLGEAGVKIMGHVRIYAQRQYEAGLTEGRATPPAQAADSALEDAAGLDWLALAGPASICVVIDREHDGEVEVSTDDVTGYGKTLREAIDAARKKGGA